ncbi:hypothetical protein [Nonomuraea sp. NPDC049695]
MDSNTYDVVVIGAGPVGENVPLTSRELSWWSRVRPNCGMR